MIDRVLGQPAVWQFFGSEISGPDLKKASDGLDVVSTVWRLCRRSLQSSVGVLGCCAVVSLCLLIMTGLGIV